MHDRLAEIGASPVQELTPIKAPPASLRRDTFSVTKATDIPRDEETNVSEGADAEAQFRLSVGQLPAWAQRQVHARPSIAQSFSTSALEKAGVEGGGKEGGEKEGRGKEGGGEGGGAGGCWAQVHVHVHMSVSHIHV